MRVLISGSGTGGHVYPALVVADALKNTYHDLQVLYVGSPEGMEQDIVARTELSYRAVDAGQVRGMAPWTLLRNMVRLWRGYRQAHGLLNEWTADVVFVTGGYVTVPVAIAAWRCRIPVIAAVNGPAVGLGCSLAALSDIVYIAETAHFADPHVQIGLVAADGGPLVWGSQISLL